MNKKILLIEAMLGLTPPFIVTIVASSTSPLISKIPQVGQRYDALGAKINHGYHGTIFEVNHGDLYAMGNNSKLQVLKNNELEFKKTDEAYPNGKLVINLQNQIIEKFKKSKISNIVQAPNTSNKHLAIMLGTTIPISLN